MQHGFEEVLAPNLYYDRHFEMDAVKILPGEYYVSTREILMVTVLGSCVGACIRDRIRGIGGINHFMLPDDRRDENERFSRSMRYGDYAMEILINQLIKLGRGARTWRPRSSAAAMCCRASRTMSSASAMPSS
jgi:chemotaxis protein CheD